MFEQCNIQVVVIEQDIYARHAIVSYLGWDRRTRVIGQLGFPQEIPSFLAESTECSRIDLVLLDTRLVSDAHELEMVIANLHRWLPRSRTLCLGHELDSGLVAACGRAGGCGYLSRDQVELALPAAVCAAAAHQFTITHDVAPVLAQINEDWARLAYVLPDKKGYPQLTQRVEQALELCVVDGMPAEVAADEMGVSTSTVRSYVKEGYRVLEDEDNTIFPVVMSPIERAFVRIGSLVSEQAPPTPKNGR